jgi:polyphenol oxidase
MMVTLPKPNGGFRWVQLPGGTFDRGGKPALVCDALAPFAFHFFTTRGWKLGEPAATEDGWIEVADAANVELARLGRLHQVHGSAVVVRRSSDGAERAQGDLGEADILLTDDDARAITIRVADCLPILMVDRRTRAVAAAHAGWRGLAARVPMVTVERLAEEFGSRPEDLLAAVGPSIGACCYEVGEDVRAQFGGRFTHAEIERWFTVHPAVLAGNPPMATLPSTRRSGHWFFDSWQCVRDQLGAAGVPPDQVLIAALCTASHGATFCSYRRDGSGVAGRMVGVIKLRSEKSELNF